MRRVAALAVLVSGLALWWGQGDPVSALALAERAGRPVDRALRVDAMRELSRVRPWQAHFVVCQAELHKLRELNGVDTGR